MDINFRIMGGGTDGSIGATWSWIVGVIACLAIIASIINSRRQRRRFGFPRAPGFGPNAVLSALGCVLVLGAIAVANNYLLPPTQHRQAICGGKQHSPGQSPASIIPYGIAVPVLIAVIVGAIDDFRRDAPALRPLRLRHRRQSRRQPSSPASRPAGSRYASSRSWACSAPSPAAISTARLNAATNAQGDAGRALYVIAAAVIGGTSLAGGTGTIAGAMLGALVMQSLQSGMVLLGIDSPLQRIVVGVVLVVAVWLDTVYRARAK